MVFPMFNPWLEAFLKSFHLLHRRKNDPKTFSKYIFVFKKTFCNRKLVNEKKHSDEKEVNLFFCFFYVPKPEFCSSWDKLFGTHFHLLISKDVSIPCLSVLKLLLLVNKIEEFFWTRLSSKIQILPLEIRSDLIYS